MGVTPKQYARSQSRGTEQKNSSATEQYSRVIAIGYALGDLLSLGIKPVGADMTIIGKKVVFRDLLRGIADIGLLGEPGKIKALEPDLIICNSFCMDWPEQLSNIAPTINIDRFIPTYKRILEVAELFGKETQARSWVRNHTHKLEEVWSKLSDQIGKDETASIFVWMEGTLYAMGMKGIGLTLYHPMAFKPSAIYCSALINKFTSSISEFNKYLSYFGMRLRSKNASI
ncbi:ABC transporter substrate-binding protein [Paenibacillus chitinolyticus]|nr:ABC transporter substrate-binding protein [Paenibacillus chitinolyticus]MCY9589903.1 ABC transporter substrate-binding protein [Paenibacillus chitinolyticus]MCY9596240.1 ABC transporter substrate-binding protein [Paenibacillus chitinolyticus]